MTGMALAQNPDDLYVSGCATFVCTPTWGTADGPALLPTLALNTNPTNTPSGGSVIAITSASQLTSTLAALTTGNCGNVYQLTAGASYSGNFTFPAVSCPNSAWITFETTGILSLPAYGSTFTSSYVDGAGNTLSLVQPAFGPCYAGVTSLTGRPSFNCPATPGTYTAQIITPNTSPAWTFTAGANNVRFIGIEFTRTSATGFVNRIIAAGNVGNVSNIVLDRVWCHGGENTDETESCIDISAVSGFAIVDSYVDDIYCASGAGHVSCDSHAFWGGGNTVNSTTEGGIKAVNDFLEGAAESCFIMGGAASNTVPTDMEVRHNTCFHPLQWNPADPSYNGGLGGDALVVKNNEEFKNGNRALLEGNYLINNWGGFSQNGSMLLLTPKNQNSGVSNVCPICQVTNVTVRYNVITGGAAPFQFATVPNANGALPAAFNGISVHDNVADNMQASNCSNCAANLTAQIWSQSTVSLAQVLFGMTFNHNTMVYSSAAGTQAAMLGISGPTIASGNASYNMTFTNNIGVAFSGTGNADGAGSCNNATTAGTNSINACWQTYTFGGNCFIANGSTSWPGTNVTSLTTQTAAYTSWNNGDAGNYAVASGACKGAGTDGRDPGVNLIALASVLAGNPAPAFTLAIQGLRMYGLSVR